MPENTTKQTTLLTSNDNIFGDNIAHIQAWDFSRANLNERSRIDAVTTVASICYQSEKSIGSETLFNRLAREGAGLPSSSFEFCPILLTKEQEINVYNLIDIENPEDPTAITNASITKFGEFIEEDGEVYLLTNLRALIADIGEEEVRNSYYNTKEECEIISKHLRVYHFKTDLPTRSQAERHRVSWQELSRRYVSGKKRPFQFYISDTIQQKNLRAKWQGAIDHCLAIYNESIEAGVKPQEARRIIPQTAYTEYWGAFLPTHHKNFITLRTEASAQWEIRKLAEFMRNN